MPFTIIAENDESQWNDITGSIYHFPKQYRKRLLPGTKVIYYKNKLKNKVFAAARLSAGAHYFGIAEIGSVVEDPESTKGDLLANIVNYQKFQKAVPIVNNNQYIENVPIGKKTNHWRVGVRVIDEDTYNLVLSLAEIEHPTHQNIDILEDIDATEIYTSVEGGRYHVAQNRYERDPKLRKEAIKIHGLSCAVCGFDFQKIYGDIGEGFIHIHHLKPISSTDGPTTVNPKTDLAAVCPNCHEMLHRRRITPLTIEELQAIISRNRNSS